MFAYVWQTDQPNQPDTMANTVFALTTNDPATEAAANAAAIKAMPAGRKSVLITNHVTKGLGPAGYNANPMFDMTLDSGLSDVLKNGADTTDPSNWVTDYAAGLIVAGVTSFDRLIYDIEHGLTFSNTLWDNAKRSALFQDVWDDADAQAMLAKGVRDWVIANRSAPGAEGALFEFGAGGGEALGDTNRSVWNNFFIALSNQYMETALVDAFESAMGISDTPASDYQQVDLSFQTWDFCGFRNASRAIRQSSPELYPRLTGQRFTAGTKNARWRWLVDSITRLKSAKASGATVVPWLMNPSRADASSPAHNANPWAWRELVIHAAYMGLTEVLGFFIDPGDGEYASPGLANWSADMAYANGVFKEASAITPLASFVAADTDLDVAEVVTGRYRTTYTDFLANGL